MTTGSRPPAPILLDAYAARSCAVKTHNRYDPRAVPTPELDPSSEEAFDSGPVHTEHVIDTLLRTAAQDPGLRVVDLRGLSHHDPEAVPRCLAAMAEGVEVIIGGLVPLDVAGHRGGLPDLWVRGRDTEQGTPGYHPVTIKAHLVHEQRRSGRAHRFTVPVSTLQHPLPGAAVPADSRAIRVNSREDDLVELAHYWRLARAAGVVAGGPPMAGVIGIDWALDTHPVITWVRLDEPLIRTFSRSHHEGWTQRSVLERYDHEFEFRVRVAEVAQLQGSDGAPRPLVPPIVNRECPRCPWWETCRPQLDDHDLSLRIDKSPLDIREIAVLRGLGIATIDDLAAVDLDELFPRYLPEVRHRPGADRRLALAQRRSRLMAAGVALERTTTGPVQVPRAVLEVDFDIETSSSDRVYLWGFLVHDTRTGARYYRDFSAFVDLDDEAEIALAERAMGWLRELAHDVESAQEGGAQDDAGGPRAAIRVYHYSAYEVNRLSALAHRSGSPLLAAARQWARGHFVDLFTVVRGNFFGVHGLGLKVIASAGAGFRWRDDDPGGLNSQRWFDEAVHADDPDERAAARTRVLEYNEDDVRATAALRDWLATLR